MMGKTCPGPQAPAPRRLGPSRAPECTASVGHGCELPAKRPPARLRKNLGEHRHGAAKVAWLACGGAGCRPDRGTGTVAQPLRRNAEQTRPLTWGGVTPTPQLRHIHPIHHNLLPGIQREAPRHRRQDQMLVADAEGVVCAAVVQPTGGHQQMH